MPLPQAQTPWPPKALAKPLAEVGLHAAWYSGDREGLANAYGRTDPQDRRPTRRAFWGRRGAPSLGQRDTRLHVPLAADIATTSADLLFSEPPTFEVPGDTTAQDRLDEIVNDGGIVNRLLEAAEVAAALGGVYLKVDWQADLAKRPLLGVVHADAALPEFAWGQLVAVTFWREVANNGRQVLRYLERHSAGQVELGLYEGTPDNLGAPVPLTEHDDVAPLAEGLTAGNVKMTGIPGLAAVYVPNMRPNRRFRGLDLGRSDYQGVEDLFDALDETWTSWMRDLRLGRGRMVVPEGFLTNLGKGQGASFDADKEIYAALQMPPGSADSITLSQFEIRVDEHARTAEELVARAVAVAGYSGQTFGLAGDVAATATEVTARERKSNVTRDKKARYWGPELGQILEAMLGVDVAQSFSRIKVARPVVSFPDMVSEDAKDVAATLDMLHRAQAMSTQVKVERLHPDWDEAAVLAEVARIRVETGQALPDPERLLPPLPPAA